ncbi:MAG: glycosyltransferase family 4 protein [SAR202 cluster bacterium]|nr:glycosyltransferase family 4 protein [SAR202 cluster bacterium]
MKVALVSPYDFTWPGGVTAHITQLSHQLQMMGHQVKVLAPFSPSRAQDLESNFVPMGRSVPIPSGGSIARISLSAWNYKKVRDLLAEEEFDVIHLHEPMAPYLPLAVLQCSRSVNIGTFHAFHGSGRWYGWSSPMLRHWFDRLDGCIAVSQAAKKHVARFFPRQYEIIPNGIDLSLFNPCVKPLPEFQDGKVNILFVGRMEKRKGLRYLLEAYGQLKWEFPNIRLIVVGPGDPDRNCYRIMAERSLKDLVMVGPARYSDLPRYYQTADIFCSPATGKESFGIVLLEAMALGKPIVATQIEGYSDILRNGHQALLARPKDSASLAEALAGLVKDTEMRAEMGRRGLEEVRQYSWERVAWRVVDYYESTMNRTYGAAAARKA